MYTATLITFTLSVFADSFPHHLIKRKKLPTALHPANDVEIKEEATAPDPNKKFLKYGTKRKATITLSDNLKWVSFLIADENNSSCCIDFNVLIKINPQSFSFRLQFSDGVMKIQSPKKRHKLYSGKSKEMFDFYDEDEKNNAVKENIENILSKLEDEKDLGNDASKELESSDGSQVKKITEDQLINILNSPGTKISLVTGTPSKVLTEIQNDSGSRLLANMSSLVINELREKSAALNEAFNESKQKK